MNIDQATLRSNPHYELVLLDRLGPEERELVSGPIADPAGSERVAGSVPYGLLRPVAGSRVEPRVVSADTALLFLTLRQPGRCPAYVTSSLGVRAGPMLGRLIADGILEVLLGDTYRTGAAAWLAFAPAATDAPVNRTAALSLEAVRYGSALTALPAEVLGLRLYFYGRQPVTPGRRRQFPDAAAVGAYLVGDRSTAGVLRGRWQATAATAPSPWRSWRPRHGSERPPSGRDAAPMHKLYVSAAVSGAPAAFAAIVVALADASGVLSFKVGRTVEGLLRPDKAVVYFATQDDLLEGANRIRQRVAGIPAHGVPFTSGITSDGLLAWGIDPPRLPDGATGEAGASWRSWLAGRLADYLVAARTADDVAEPWRFALERLRLDGVDPETWVPAAGAIR